MWMYMCMCMCMCMCDLSRDDKRQYALLHPMYACMHMRMNMRMCMCDLSRDGERQYALLHLGGSLVAKRDQALGYVDLSK